MAFTPASDSDVVILNDGAEYSAKFAERRGSRKPRRTIEVESEPLLFDFNADQLGMQTAEAIKNVLSQAIKKITALAAPSTLRYRERAKRRMSGEPSPRAGYRGDYEKRYSGGRIGVKVPGQSTQLFNDSGRLADGLFVRQNTTDKSFTVNVPANRLDPSTFKPGAFEAMLVRLRSLVPELADVRRLLESSEVREAIEAGIRGMIMKAEAKQRDLLLARAAARRQAVAALLRALRAVA